MARVIRWAVVACLLVLPPILGRVAPDVFTDFRMGLASRAAIYVVAALALNLLVGYAGQISLGHAAFLGAGAFTAGYLMWWLGLSFVVAFAAAVVVGGCLAFVVGLPSLRIRGLYLAVSTLAFGVFMESSVFRIPALTGGQGGTPVYRPRQGDLELILNADFFVVCAAVMVAVWMLDRSVLSSKLGRGFLAIRENEDVASSFGVNVSSYKLFAFVLSGAFAGMAGALYGSLTLIAQPSDFTFQDPPQFSLVFLIIIVLGGLGSRIGAATAATFFAVFPRIPVFRALDLELWIPLIGTLLLVYTVARHPRGLAQAFLEAREAKAVKAARTGEKEEEFRSDVVPALPAVGLGGERLAGERGAEGNAGETVLEVTGASVNFGGIAALNDAGLEVPRGKIVGLIGPNGAGKTTMFNVISGFRKPDAGKVLLNGEDVSGLPPHARAARGLGRTFQGIGLAKDLTVRENFLLAQHPLAAYAAIPALLRLPKMRKVEDRLEERVAASIEALGFERFAGTPVRDLSHGMQRLVELGCALITSPELLLLDEPSGGMAPAAAESLAERLIDVRDVLGRTVLLIEHHIPLVLAVCDEVYVLNFGQILAHGTTAEITSKPEVVAAYFGEAA